MPRVYSFLAGIGGRDVTPGMVHRMFDALLNGEPAEVTWVDLEKEKEVPIHG